MRASSYTRVLSLIFTLCFLYGCAKTSPRLEIAIDNQADGLSAQDIFDKTFTRHGGDHLSKLNDVNVAINGHWHYLITKIQPEVTDESYRQVSQERILVNPKSYAAFYTGDAGNKRVYRTANDISIAYNNSIDTNIRKNQASALTADAFYLFTLGPLALSEQVDNWKRLADATEKGNAYYRINGMLKPGIGMSPEDHISLWIDKNSGLTFRMHITLEGFETTKGAHVDTTYLKYTKIEQFTLPTHFFERVIGPIKLDAHEWWYTGLDINRDLGLSDIAIEDWSDRAKQAAKTFDGKSRE